MTVRVCRHQNFFLTVLIVPGHLSSRWMLPVEIASAGDVLMADGWSLVPPQALHRATGQASLVLIISAYVGTNVEQFPGM